VCARISPGREVRGLTRGLYRALTVLRWQRLQIRRMGVHARCARGGVCEGQSLLTQHRNEHCSDTCLGWACEGTHGLRNMASGQYARFTQSGISVSASHVVTVVRGAVLSTTTRGCHQRSVAKEDVSAVLRCGKGKAVVAHRQKQVLLLHPPASASARVACIDNVSTSREGGRSMFV